MDEQTIRGWYAECPDVKVHSYRSEHTKIACILVYDEGLCDFVRISELVLPELQRLTTEAISTMKQHVTGQVMLTPIEHPREEKEWSRRIFNGQLIICFPEEEACFQCNIPKKPQRKPDDSNMENSTLGSRDGFVEELSVNIALIRKRLRTNQLQFEEFRVGTEYSTNVVLLYMKGISDRTYLLEARKRLSSIEPESITSAAQLAGLILDSPYTLFPLTTYTGRPDFAVDCLKHDRFVIIVDGNPSVLIAPANLFLLLKSSEDIFLSYGVALLGRLSRIVGLFLTICLPGFWVAVTQYNQDQLPFPLLATITVARAGLPLSATLEMGLTLFFLELFREAGSRLPKSIGQPITVVGGLIIGDAAIRAGLISPSMIVIGALTAVTASTIANLNLSGNATILRMLVFGVSAFLGLFGFMFSIIMMMWYMASLRSFGVPYLAPISPLYWRDILSAIVKLPATKTSLHPYMLKVFKKGK